MDCRTNLPMYGTVSSQWPSDRHSSFHDVRSSSSIPIVAANPLERLAHLVRTNNALMDELTLSRARIVSAQAYLDRPGGNIPFGKAHLDRCRRKHSGVLALLRANRIESLRLLGQCPSAA